MNDIITVANECTEVQNPRHVYMYMAINVHC